MRTKSLDTLIAQETEYLGKLTEKQEALTQKIKVCRANLDRYKLLKQGEKLRMFSNALDDKGIAIEEVLEALTNGNLSELQAKLDNSTSLDVDA